MKECLFGNPIHNEKTRNTSSAIRVCSSFLWWLNPLNFSTPEQTKPRQLLVLEEFDTTRFLESLKLPHPWFGRPPRSIIKPPIPDTKITLAIKRFFLLSKSILCSTKIFKPLAAITPKRAIDNPPNTGVGIECKSADSFPIKLMTTAITAAPEIT